MLLEKKQKKKQKRHCHCTRDFPKLNTKAKQICFSILFIKVVLKSICFKVHTGNNATLSLNGNSIIIMYKISNPLEKWIVSKLLLGILKFLIQSI